MQKISKRAIFNFEESDSTLINELSDYLDDDKNIVPIYEFFEVEEPDKKIKIEIVPTKKEYDEKFKVLGNYPPDYIVQDWMIGCFNSTKNKILYLSLNDYKNTSHAFKPDDYDKALNHFKKTIVHEYVHYVTELFAKKHNCGWRAKYISEGLAICLSHQKDDMKLKFNYHLDEIINGNAHYNAYYLLTKYLIENYDKSFTFKLIESNRKAHEFLKDELYDKVNKLYNQENI